MSSLSTFEPPILRSGEEGLVGYIHLLLSLYFPRRIPTDGRFQANFVKWLSDEFLCATAFEDFAIELVSTLQMQSDCGSSGYKSYPPAILWNAPAAWIETHVEYATWNISYPVYDWGDANDLQQGLQSALNSQIINEGLELPWEDASLSVVGLEQNTFNLPPPTTVPPILWDNTTTASPNTTTSITGGTVLSIDPAMVTTVQYIGAILLVFHSIVLILVHLVGQSYSEKIREQQEQQAEKPLLDTEELDDMLLLSKDHNHLACDTAVPLVLPTTYATTNSNTAKRIPASPTRSLVSNASKASSAHYMASDSLFPPMHDDNDDVSEAGTEVIMDISSNDDGNGSIHSISSAVLEDADGSSIHSKESAHQMSQQFLGNMLGNVNDDDEEDKVSDIMIF